MLRDDSSCRHRTAHRAPLVIGIDFDARSIIIHLTTRLSVVQITGLYSAVVRRLTPHYHIYNCFDVLSLCGPPHVCYSVVLCLVRSRSTKCALVRVSFDSMPIDDTRMPWLSRISPQHRRDCIVVLNSACPDVVLLASAQSVVVWTTAAFPHNICTVCACVSRTRRCAGRRGSRRRSVLIVLPAVLLACVCVQHERSTCARVCASFVQKAHRNRPSHHRDHQAGRFYLCVCFLWIYVFVTRTNARHSVPYRNAEYFRSCDANTQTRQHKLGKHSRICSAAELLLTDAVRRANAFEISKLWPG